MTCCSKRSTKRGKRTRRNAIYQDPEVHPMTQRKLDSSFMNDFLRESMHCGKCREVFNLNSNELKIHCNLCNQFFHCGIAGECVGEDCKVVKHDGSIHRASYCNDCVGIIYEKNKCLCKDCSK